MEKKHSPVCKLYKTAKQIKNILNLSFENVLIWFENSDVPYHSRSLAIRFSVLRCILQYQTCLNSDGEVTLNPFKFNEFEMFINSVSKMVGTRKNK